MKDWKFIERINLRKEVKTGDVVTGKDMGFVFSKTSYTVRRVTKDKVWMS